jgi:hypothetical protein
LNHGGGGFIHHRYGRRIASDLESRRQVLTDYAVNYNTKKWIQRYYPVKLLSLVSVLFSMMKLTFTRLSVIDFMVRNA